MASEVKLRPRARSDLEEIFLYSIERWSLAQASRYVLDLEAAVKRLARSTERGRLIDESEPATFKYAIGSHFIVYRPTAWGVDVLRVLHQRMDVVSIIRS